jgi:hypothetical protein
VAAASGAVEALPASEGPFMNDGSRQAACQHTRQELPHFKEAEAAVVKHLARRGVAEALDGQALQHFAQPAPVQTQEEQTLPQPSRVHS